jgi:hypothetical protein
MVDINIHPDASTDLHQMSAPVMHWCVCERVTGCAWLLSVDVLHLSEHECEFVCEYCDCECKRVRDCM